MRRLNSILVFTLLLLLSVTGLGQNQSKDRPFRIELQAPEDAYPYDVINLGSKGIVVYFENQIISKNQASWRFIYYDAYFKKKWNADIVLNRFMEPQIEYSDSLMIGLLFKYDGKRKSSENQQFVAIRLKDTAKTMINIPLEQKFTPNVLYAQADRAFVSYYDDDDEQFYLLKYGDKQLQKIDFPKVQKGHAQFVNPIPNSSQLLVGVRNDISKKDNQLILFRVSIDGLIISQTNLPTDDAVFFNRCQMIQSSNDSLIVIGTYSLKNSISNGIFTPATETNTGIFTVLVSDNQKVDSLNLYNFSFNKLIFKYLSSREQEKTKKKLENSDPKSESTSLNLQLINHLAIKSDSNIIFLTEAYYPEYRTEESVNYDFYGRPFPNNRTYFEGYRYTNCLVFGFDFNGKLKWDNNFSLNEMIAYDLKPRVAMNTDSNNVLMAYSFEGNIVTMAVNGYSVVQNIERSRIEPMYETDITIKTEKPLIQYWYKNYFLSMGYQKIKNSSRNGKSRDNAFFLNKMIYKNSDNQ